MVGGGKGVGGGGFLSQIKRQPTKNNKTPSLVSGCTLSIPICLAKLLVQIMHHVYQMFDYVLSLDLRSRSEVRWDVGLSVMELSAGDFSC